MSLLEDNVAEIDPIIELFRSRKGHLMNIKKVAVVKILMKGKLRMTQLANDSGSTENQIMTWFD